MIRNKRLIVGVVTLGIFITLGVTSAFASSNSSTAAPAAHAPTPTATQKHVKAAFVEKQVLEVTALETGLTPQEIRTALKNGKSLQDISSTKSTQIKAELLGQLKAKLQLAVSKGHITQAQMDARMDKASKALNKLFNKHFQGKAKAKVTTAPAPVATS